MSEAIPHTGAGPLAPDPGAPGLDAKCPRCHHEAPHDSGYGCVEPRLDQYGNPVFPTGSARSPAICGCRYSRPFAEAEPACMNCGCSASLHPRAYAHDQERRCRGRVRAFMNGHMTAADCACRWYRAEPSYRQPTREEAASGLRTMVAEAPLERTAARPPTRKLTESEIEEALMRDPCVCGGNVPCTAVRHRGPVNREEK